MYMHYSRQTSLTAFQNVWQNRCNFQYKKGRTIVFHLLLHLSLYRGGHWSTTDDFKTSFLHFSLPLPSGTWRTPGLSIPWCCLPTSSSVCLVFFPISLCRARWFWPDLMNGGHDHTIAVCVSLQWSGGLRIVRLPAGSLHGLPRS